jgi:hypothetical protein
MIRGSAPSTLNRRPLTEPLCLAPRLIGAGGEYEDCNNGKGIPAASKDVERAMHKRKQGTLKSGRSGKKVTSKKQAIAIGLSEARKKGKKVPAKKSRKG